MLQLQIGHLTDAVKTGYGYSAVPGNLYPHTMLVSTVELHPEYAGLLGAMMKDWRKLFADDGLPFYIVELADFLAPDDPGRAAWAGLRKQQAMAAETDGNAVLIKNSDTGEWNDIHPLDKKTAAGRLVEAVMRRIKN